MKSAEKPVVIRIRVELDRDFYNRAKKQGYNLADMRAASGMRTDTNEVSQVSSIFHDGRTFENFESKGTNSV